MLVRIDESGNTGSRLSKYSNKPSTVAVALFNLFLLAFLTGCDLNTPPPVSYSLPGEEVLRDVPFNSSSVFAIAWDPDGNHLAVAERAGAEAMLMGLTVTNPGVRSLNLSFRYLRRLAAIPHRRVVVGETPEGELWAWSLQGAPPERFFDGPVQTPHWSLSESGEDLIYVPKLSDPDPQWQVRYVNPRTREERILIDSTSAVHQLNVFPDGSGALISYRERAGDTTYPVLAYYPLPSGQPRILLEGTAVPTRIAPSPDGKKFAFVRTIASRYDLQQGFVDSLISVRQPSSDLIWPKDGRWVAMINSVSFAFELRAYDLQTHNDIVLAQNLSFVNGASGFVLFAIGETIAFFVNSPERVSVFDRRDFSFSTWFSETLDGSIRSIAWDPTGENIFFHVAIAGGISAFYLVKKDDWTLHQKNYSLSSISLLPDGIHFLVANSNTNALRRDALTFSDLKTIFLAKWSIESVQVHPSGRIASVIDRYYDQTGGSGYTCVLRALDLSSYAIVDTIALPGSSGEWQWMNAADNNGQLTGIWRANGQYYYHVLLEGRRIMTLYQSNRSAFAVVPGSDRFSVLEGNVLRTLQLSAPLP